MTFGRRTLVVEVLGDSKSLERMFARSGRAAQGWGNTMSRVARGTAIAVGAAGLGGLALALRAGIQEFTEHAKVAAQTEAVLKSTGSVAGVTAESVDALSSSLMRLSGVDDEAIQQGQNLLLTFKNIRNEAGRGNDVFDQAAKAALDLSVVLGGTVASKAMLLGKALNDPARGLTRLQRAGVSFTKSQESQIKALTKAGDVMGAQKIILAELTSQFGGSAEALGNTLPGKLNILRESFNNVAGTVVGRFEPAITGAADAVIDWLDKTENQQRIQSAVERTTRAVSDAAQGFASALGDVRAVLEPVVRQMGGLKEAVKLLVVVMAAAKVAAFATALTGLSTQALAATTRVKALRIAMLRLGAIGVIAIGVEVLLNRDKIDDSINEFLRGHGLGFFANTKIEIPVDAKAADLQAFRDGLLELGGISRPLVAELDKIIARMRVLEAADFENLVVPGEQNRAAATAAARAVAPRVDRDTSKDKVLPGVQTALDAIAKSVEEAGRQALAAAAKAAAAVKAWESLQAAADRAELAVTQAGLALDRAGATPGLRDDIAALRVIGVLLAAQEKAISAQLKLRRDDLGLQQQLVGIQGEQIQNEQALAQAVKERAANQKAAALAATQARQFRALGLDASGGALVPSADNLRARLGNISDAVKGTFLDTSKTRSLLARIRSVLAGGFGKISQETRATIKTMLDDIANQMDQSARGPLTKGSSLNVSKVLDGLGLGPEMERELRARLSRFNTSGLGVIPVGAGTSSTAVAPQPITLNATFEVDGQVIGRSTKRFLRNDKRHNPTPRR